jgi:hypothetical protein
MRSNDLSGEADRWAVMQAAFSGETAGLLYVCGCLCL